MKRFLTTFLFWLLPFSAVFAGGHVSGGTSFSTHFQDSTLRLDYVFCGDASHQAIYLRQVFRTSVWAGRHAQLTEPLLRGNGQIRLLDPSSGVCLYAASFSSLFQEWVTTEEATRVQKAFENSFQLPFPKHPVTVEITLRDTHGKVSASLRHPLNPADILIRPLADNRLPMKVVHGDAAPEDAVDIVIVPEGYAKADEAKFWADASRAAEALFSHEPFKGRAAQFVVRAVFAESAESGVSIPHKGMWRQTLLSSHFDTFYTERYLTTSSVWDVWNKIGTLPFEHVMVLVNTPVYGGGGIYNSLTISSSDHPAFIPVLVHEFGHAFAGLADEYYYDDQFEPQYPADAEPWEPNITTLVNFGAKWADMLETGEAGMYEGGGYQSKGVFRPAADCRMKTNECARFCPVCTRAIERMVDFSIARQDF